MCPEHDQDVVTACRMEPHAIIGAQNRSGAQGGTMDNDGEKNVREF